MFKSCIKKRGFTLAELMVCLALISVIATILMPAVERLKPNKKKIMFKKAYYLTERVVSELVNDEDVYPMNEGNVGFDSVGPVTVNGVTYGGDADSDEAKAKFCKLFASKLNTISSDITCQMLVFGSPGKASLGSFQTTDGMLWIIPFSTFSDKSFFHFISIDVNGVDAPNCFDSDPGCTDPDRFHIRVRADGKIEVTSPKAIEYVGTVNIIEKEKK